MPLPESVRPYVAGIAAGGVSFGGITALTEAVLGASGPIASGIGAVLTMLAAAGWAWVYRHRAETKIKLLQAEAEAERAKKGAA